LVRAAEAILIKWPCVVVACAVHIKVGNVLSHIGEDLVHGKRKSNTGEVK